MSIPRPVKVQEWDGKKRPIGYMVKSKFWRRIGSDEGQRFNKANGKNRSCRATDKQPLRSSQSANCSSTSTRSVSKDDWSCAGSRFCISGPRVRLLLNVVRTAVCA